MSYYHVLIETNEPNEIHYELDLRDLSEIKEEIVVPYLKGEQFIVDGYFFDKEMVKRFIIGSSYFSSHAYVKIEDPNTSSPEGIVLNDKYTTNITRRIIKESKSLLQEATPKPKVPVSNNPKVPVDKSKVFIVHGHDEVARLAVARFIERIGLEAIILHEQASSGNTIIEKIKANSNVGFGIVLYTPCDLGASQEKKDELKPRARQNVVFEHGYLIGKIGRENVCALVKGDIEKPNDISGVVYVEMDKGDGWKLTVAKEMKERGYKVDLNKI